MDQTVIFPSCQWFKESGLVVSSDGWILYGGPSKSLCVLEPLPPNHGENQKYRALVVPRAQEQKITCLDIIPEWPTKRAIITGTTDGSVKQWSLGYVDNKLTVKATHSHEVHRGEKEEVAGVGYCTGTCAITVGCYGTLVKWDINSNIVKNYNALKGLKPTCLRCSPHLSMHIAIGTKQGIVLVLDMSESCKVLYKVRAHDEEVYSLSWCPKYEVHLKKALKKNVSSRKKGTKVSENDKNIESTHVELGVEEASNISSKEVPKEESSKNTSQVDLPEHDGDEIVVQEHSKNSSQVDLSEHDGDEIVQEHSKNSLQMDSSEHDETEIVEDDMFEIYKDHEPDEFGHKKYQSEEILVKVKDEQKKETDYLAECIRLKEDILKRKNVEECSIQSLVDAMDKAHLNENTTDKQHIKTNHDQTESKSGVEGSNNENQIPASVHIHRHLIASVGKLGSVRIWSKAGNLVANGSVQKQKSSIVSGIAILWYKPHELLVADGRGALIKCNPIYIDYKNTLEWKFIHHIHLRGLYCITSGIPKKQEFEDDVDWPVWTVGQDRKVVQYSLKENKPLAVHVTCGGFVYNMAACPYDAHRIALSVGDGAVRVWHASETTDNVLPLTGGEVLSYWQNVLGKVLTVAWHPTQENLLAFGTAESRVGVIDTSGRVERPARALLTALGSGVYALSWVANKLYACGGNQVVCYQPNKPHKAAEKVPVVVEGREWRISNLIWSERALVVGTTDGAVAVLQPHPPHQHRTHAYPFSKLIYTMEWHPLQVSSSSEESVHKNEMAVCSAEKHIVILEFREEGSIPSLAVVRTLEGHRASVNRVCWSPHHEARLLSASNDNTFRVWDTAEGVCISMYVTPDAAALTGIWSPDPAWAHCVVTGGADCCVRVWDTRSHLYDTKAELKEATEKKKKRNKTGRKKTEQEETKEAHKSEEDITVADTETKKTKASKKFLLPVMYKQLLSDKIDACKKLFEMHLNKLRETAANGAALPEKVFMNGETAQKEQKNQTRSYDCDFIKIFGSTNDVNELLDMEQARHASNGFFEAWIMLALLRGDVAGAVAFAAQREVLSPFLLSLTPCVSYKYWKDTQQLYLAQMEKLSVRGDEERLVYGNWGGLTYKRAVTLLALHEVSAAVELLSGSGLHKEAYALCRARHLASLADGVLRRWADHERFASHYTAAAACYLALGDVAEAAAVLGRSDLEEHLQLAAEMARFCGQNTFAAHVAHKGEKMRVERESNPDILLPSLPTRGDLLASVSAQSQTTESDNDKSACQGELEQDNVS